MTRETTHQISSRLDFVFDMASGISDDEVKAHFARYLCVLTSGFLERSVKIIIINYVTDKSAPVIQNYLNYSLKKVRNLKTNNILNLLCSFSIDWKNELEVSLTDEEKDSIDSIVSNRHNIAHGYNVGVSFGQISVWYKNLKSVINKISTVVN